MRKFILGVLTFLWLGFWAIFAQNILPDEAQIEVKSPIIQWEATNLTITMLKNWSKMSSYRGTVYITITDENWGPLNKNDYTALHTAAQYNYIKIGELLISKGADINAIDVIYQIMINLV